MHARALPGPRLQHKNLQLMKGTAMLLPNEASPFQATPADTVIQGRLQLLGVASATQKQVIEGEALTVHAVSS